MKLKDLSKYRVSFANDILEKETERIYKLHGKNIEYFGGSPTWSWFLSIIEESHRQRYLGIGDTDILNYNGTFISIIEPTLGTNYWISNTKLLRYYGDMSPYITILIISELENMYGVSIESLHTVASLFSDPLPELKTRLESCLIGETVYGYFYPNAHKMSINKNSKSREFEIKEIIFENDKWKNRLTLGFKLLDSKDKKLKECYEVFGWRLFATEQELIDDKKMVRSYWLKHCELKVKALDGQIKSTGEKLESLKNEKKELEKTLVNFDILTNKILG